MDTLAKEVDQYLLEMCIAVEVRHTSSIAPTVLLLSNTAHTTGMLEWNAQVSCFLSVHYNVSCSVINDL